MKCFSCSNIKSPQTQRLNSLDSVSISTTSKNDTSKIHQKSSCLSMKSTSSNYPTNFLLKYDFTTEILGSGSTCVVKKCIRFLDKKEFAVKIVKKNELTKIAKKRLQKEISTLLKLKYCNYIIQIEDTYENSKYILIVTQLCNSIDLYDYIFKKFKDKKKKNTVDEREIAYIFAQICTAVHTCHRKKIIHRDIKPENILFKDKNSCSIVLSDFGLSNIGKLLTTKCGTPNYLAPEIITNHFYTSKSDWWSCGITLYVLLSGTYPYHNENHMLMYKSILNDNISFSHCRWNHISKEAKDLCEKLLVKDPKRRIGHKGILRHPFITNYLKQKV